MLQIEKLEDIELNKDFKDKWEIIHLTDYKLKNVDANDIVLEISFYQLAKDEDQKWVQN